jgi:hypothetical protein
VSFQEGADIFHCPADGHGGGVEELAEKLLKYVFPVGLGKSSPQVTSGIRSRLAACPRDLKGVIIPIRLLSWVFPVDGEAVGMVRCGTR